MATNATQLYEGRSAEPTGPPPDLASPKRFWLAHFGVSMPSNFMDAVVLRSERALALPSIRNWPIRPEDNAPREVPSRLLSLAWFHRPWTSSGVAGVKGRWLTQLVTHCLRSPAAVGHGH